MSVQRHTMLAIVAATDSSCVELQELIDQHEAAMEIDRKLWSRVCELDEMLPLDLPVVRVEIGRQLRGKNDDGSDNFAPIYAYNDKQIDEVLDERCETTLMIFGRNDAQIATIKERHEATAKRLKAKLASIAEERNFVRDGIGLNQALKEAKAQSDVVKAIEHAILAFRPGSLRAASMLCAWAVNAAALGDEGSYVEEEDLPRVVHTLAGLVHWEAA